MKSWAENFELTDETMSTLAKKGFNSFKTISRLTGDILAKDFSKTLNSAQFLMLEEAVDSLAPAKPAQPRADRDDMAAASTSQQVNPTVTAATESLQQKLSSSGTLSVADLLGLIRGADTAAASHAGNNGQETTCTQHTQSRTTPLQRQVTTHSYLTRCLVTPPAVSL